MIESPDHKNFNDLVDAIVDAWLEWHYIQRPTGLGIVPEFLRHHEVESLTLSSFITDINLNGLCGIKYLGETRAYEFRWEMAGNVINKNEFRYFAAKGVGAMLKTLMLRKKSLVGYSARVLTNPTAS